MAARWAREEEGNSHDSAADAPETEMMVGGTWRPRGEGG